MDNSKVPSIAIHHNPGGFSDRWEQICQESDIPFVSVNLFEEGLIAKLREAHIKKLLFQLSDHTAPRTRLASAALCRAAELAGIEVFPNSLSYWHCDNKIAQCYLMEALNLPRCPTWIFYDKQEALTWARKASYPKVFKLRCGAGSSNVQLVRTLSEAERLVKIMFSAGMSPVGSILDDASTKIYKHRRNRDWRKVFGRGLRTLARIRRMRQEVPRERGYIYFQEFLPGNDFDTRVTVIGERAFAFRRFVRPNDFRASGSGRLDHSDKGIDLRIIKLAHLAAAEIGSQCLAFDFVYDRQRNPVLLEMCFTFVAHAVQTCPGYWDQDLTFHTGRLWPQDLVLQDMLRGV